MNCLCTECTEIARLRRDNNSLREQINANHERHEREVAGYLRRLQEAHGERDRLRAALTIVTYAKGAGPGFDWDAYYADILAAAEEALK